MRGLSTTPTPSSPHPRGYRQGAFARLGGMRADRRNRPPRALAGNGARMARAANPRIEITPTEAQYTQLCRDLAKLRKTGAASHTAAIVAAVHAAAAGGIVSHAQNETPGGA